MNLAIIMQKDGREPRTYNQRLVNRGKIIDIYMSADAVNRTELAAINRGKIGRPYRYSNAIVTAAYSLKCLINRGYRFIGGFIEDMAKYIKKVPKPDFRTIWYRISRIKEFCRFNCRKSSDGSKIEIAIDSTGLKSIYDGEYRTYKYDKRKNWLKLHIIVDEKSGVILNARLTKSNVGDSKVFQTLIKGVKGVGKVYGDGAYDSDKIFGYCARNGIEPLIPVRINASKDHKTIRSYIVAEQLGMIKRRGYRDDRNHYYPERYRKRQQELWKRRVKYGRRWMVESAFSSFKRMFGESVFSRKPDMIEKEIAAKVAVFNSFR